MNSVTNANGTERAKIFEALFTSPGMNETCKIVLNPSRQTILLLSRMIEHGMEAMKEERGDELLLHVPVESINHLKVVMEEMLKRGGLVEFYDRLKKL